MATPQIRRLHIQRFRGIHSLVWLPDPGMNLVLGGGNVGKTTILDAIALLLHPTSGYPLTDADYWQRKVEDEFEIEAIMSLPVETGIHQRNAMAWPWEWDGTNARVPDEDADGERQYVFKVRVRGTSDQEVVHELVQPDGIIVSLNVGLRRAIGLVRLSGDDRNERDLRLIQGAGLDRFLADKTLRAKLSQRFSQHAVSDDLSTEAQTKLGELDATFRSRSLPTDLGIGFVGGSGTSINALIGLTSDKEGVALPLTSWGSGTRRLAALAIADSLQDKQPITVVDELERGLEPYRQRRLVADLLDKKTQVFLTTHSASVLGAAAGAALWYLDAAGKIGRLEGERIAIYQAKYPETFLARFAVVAEGITEVGFLEHFFGTYVGANWEELGIRVADGGGNENVLILLEALTKGNLCFAGFADNEGKFSGRWDALKARLDAQLFRWPNGCIEEYIIPLVSDDMLLALITDPEDVRTGDRLRTLADRLSLVDKSYEAIIAAANNAGTSMKDLIVQAATGKAPADADATLKKQFSAHQRHWFKSLEGGHELAEKVHGLAIWTQLRPLLLPFLNAVRAPLSMPPLPDDIA